MQPSLFLRKIFGLFVLLFIVIDIIVPIVNEKILATSVWRIFTEIYWGVGLAVFAVAFILGVIKS
jgi:hypothetical protein